MAEINLEEYGRKVFEMKDSPSSLDTLGTEIVGWYCRYQSMMIPLDIAEARFFQEKKDWKSEKVKSDATVRSMWRCTEDGIKMIELDRVLKTLEKLLTRINSSIRRAENEAKNLQ